MITTIPINFLLHIEFTLKTKGIAEIIFIQGLFIVIITAINVFIMKKIHSIAKKKPDPIENFKNLSLRISKTPFFIVIVYLSVLQLSNGFDEFLGTIIWLLSLLYLLISVIAPSIYTKNETKVLQLNFLLWVLVAGFITSLRHQFAQQNAFIQNITGQIITNQMINQILTFILLNITFFMIIYYLLTKTTVKRQNKINLYGNFIVLVILASYIPIIAIKLIVVILTVFLIVVKENSINLKEKVNFDYLREKIVQISIFSIAFLLM